MSFLKLIDLSFQIEKKNSKRGKNFKRTDSFSVKQTVVFDALIRLVLAVGFVVSMCTLSCSVQNASLRKVKDEVDGCRREIKEFHQEAQEEVKRFNAILLASSNACEKVVAIETRAHNAVREFSDSIERLPKGAKAFRPCCWCYCP